jgi:hypothetical protein
MADTFDRPSRRTVTGPCYIDKLPGIAKSELQPPYTA